MARPAKDIGQKTKFRRSLRQKIMLGYVVLVILFSAMGIWAIHNFVVLSRAIDNIMVENYRSIRAAENMMEAVERQDSSQLELLLGREQQSVQAFNYYQSEFMRWFSKAEDNVTVEGEKEVIDALRQAYNDYLLTFTVLRDEYINSGYAQAGRIYLDQSKDQFMQVKQQLNKLLGLNHDAMTRANQIAVRDANRAILSTMMVVLATIVVALLFGLKVSKIIIYPTKILTAKAKRIGEGDLDQTIDIQSNDEIGQLAEEFNKMTRQLKQYEQTNIRKLMAEKQKSEAIVRSIADAVIVTDSEHRVVLLNPAAEQLFDIKEAAAVGHHFLEVINNEQVFAAIKEAQDQGQDRRNGQEENDYLEIQQDGDKKRYYNLEVTPVIGDDGNFHGVVTLLQDVTRLKEIDQMKSDFVSTVSHEFRTPLTSINMSVGLLQEMAGNVLDDKQQELLSVIKEDTERLTKLVSDLLNLSKIESGRIQMEFEKAQVSELIASALRPFYSQAEEKGIQLSLEVPESLPAIRADVTKITWVLSNLVGNAFRYTPSGGKVKVLAERKGGKVFVSVQDTGVGIPKEYQSRIFDKFVQVKRKDPGTDVGGAGLGLAICREIIEAHGGRIWVESEEGEGATFTFTLQTA